MWLVTLVGLAACSPHQRRIDSFLNAGLYGEACGDATVHRPDRQPEIEARMLAALDLTLAMEPVPAEAFGVEPRGYGTDWVLVGIGQSRAPGVASVVRTRIDIDGWDVCEGCDRDWMLEHMAPPPPTEPEPKVSVSKHGSGILSPFGALGSALLDLGKVVTATVMLPVTLMVDTVLLPATMGKHSPSKPYGLTKLTLDVLAGDVGGSSYSPPSTQVSSVPVTQSQGMVCRGDLPCSSMVVLRREGETLPTRAEVDVDIDIGRCTVTAAAVPVPLVGDDISARLGAFPSEGRAVQLQRTP